MEKQQYCIGLQDADRAKIALTGGKAANLGELYRIPGLNVPAGFCITTNAYTEIVESHPQFNSLLKELEEQEIGNRKAITLICDKIRGLIETLSIPGQIEKEILNFMAAFSQDRSFAIRSSATAEDLPSTSFAGQQDSWLNIRGNANILQYISKCWASLFTERAVVYRMQNGFDHRKVRLAVIVQEMIFPDVSGIMFTADPVTSNRKQLSIDAGYGLGEALVSGITSADNYKVKNGEITGKKIGTKKLAIYGTDGNGTQKQEVDTDLQNRQALTDAQILQLAQLGRQIEAYFGYPQDIEWCLADERFYIVQSRPVTTLFPIPQTNDNSFHVFVSVGHQQMMMDAIKPLGLSFFNMIAARPMYNAGGRLFVDVTQELASPAKRHMLVNVLGKSDPLIQDALRTILERDNGTAWLAGNIAEPDQGNTRTVDYQALKDFEPGIVTELIRESENSLKKLKAALEHLEGPAMMDQIARDIVESRKELFEPASMEVIMTAMNAASWLNEHILLWLGEKNIADKISQSVPNNITSEMGLALLDIADTIRPYPQIVELLQQAADNRFLDILPALEGGAVVRNAIETFLKKYGMRCVGEIDITRDRWAEQPVTLLPLILSNIRNCEQGAAERKFRQGLEEATQKEQDIISGLLTLPDGAEKAKETKRMIRLVRDLSGYREYPKYRKICRYFLYKLAMMKEADRLVAENVIMERSDIFYLSFEELRSLVQTRKADRAVIHARKEEFKRYEKLKPPRVLTSDGEIITGSYNRAGLPEGAIAGLAVSSGIVEGKARVILKMEDADLEAGDILVTTFTDPSWTPLFVSVKGLITEVGGLMTHGAVIAREYGLPAVVGVEQATRLIRDGQMIRLNGTDGYVELL